MSEHTPGILELFDVGRTTAIMDDRGRETVHWAGFDRSEIPLAEHKANAARLVACWNACAGIETEDLEADPSTNLLSLHVARADDAEALLRSLAQNIIDSYAAHKDGYARQVLRGHYENAKAFLAKTAPKFEAEAGDA